MKADINPLLKTEIGTQVMVVERFIKQCEMAAMKDDGVISKEERALLNKIAKASQKYVAELKKLY
jgi:hypothetical protein